MAVAGLHKTSVLDSYLGENHSRSTTRTSFIRKMWRNLENESKNGENGRVLTTPESPCSSTLEIESIESENTSTIDANEIENQCPQNQSDVPEKERVRKIFHEWGSKSFECKRVRIVREWIESSSQTGQTCLQDSVTENDTQIKQVHDRIAKCGPDARSSIRRIYGRQAVLDLLKKFEKERKKEVDDLLENRFVSNFGHRHRIQALLKGRFLRNQRFVDDEKLNSVAATASELGLLRRTHAVSDIRSIFNVVNYEQSDEITESFESTNLTNGWESHNTPEFTSPIHEDNELPLIVDHTQSDSDTLSDNAINYEQIVPNEIDETLETNVEELEIHEQSVTEENDDDDVWRNLIHNESDEGINVNSIENEQEWYEETIRSDFEESHEDILEDPTESWFGGNSYLESVLIDRNNNAFYPSDDENGSSRIELRELTNRRRVSNLLQSDFGTRLDQLMQSYVQRQYQTTESENEWMQEHQPLSVDDPTDSHQTTDSHNHFLTDGEIINGLRTDMDLLQQRMDDMQKMLESCMNMQLQLQQSVKTEVFTSLNRSSNPQGVCFLCCDNGFESLPNRSAHMYICSKCADNINWSKLKESIRHP